MKNILTTGLLVLAAAAMAVQGCETAPEETSAQSVTPAAGPSPGRTRESATRTVPMEFHTALRFVPGPTQGGLEHLRPPSAPLDREAYQHLADNPVKRAAEAPVSTFSVDVDTGAYANTRRFLDGGLLPPQDAVRVEELINYFSYDYPGPADSQRPFEVTTEVAATPWNPDTYLLHIGIKGYEVPRADRPPANLVFLVDVSGSMSPPDKLPLLVKALRLLTRELTAEDRVSIAVYAGAAGAVLEPTPGDETRKIAAALGQLSAGGSTAGASGIRLAYDMAQEAFIEGGINRVILATDGDFNVGVADVEALKDLIERRRDGGITLTTLGFGTGNYNEALMEQIADVGNGNYAYIDSLKEARKVLVTELSSTLHTIAKDVKVQIEFNPAVVAEYRLIGYENRVLRREDFRNDKVDAGDIGAGHTVTALYEIALAGGKGERLDPLRYGEQAVAEEVAPDSEFAFLKLRYKLPEEDTSRLIEVPLAGAMLEDAPNRPSEAFRFAASVAAFGQLLRGGTYTGSFAYADVEALARDARGLDANGYRSEFLSLVQLAGSLNGS
ncbi:MAG: VWA domain-containing protein [Rhodospirillales bacterium]|nr:VWA domain-containing protein [Rhodospirillales bacterium]MDH3966235.1 VWA domain-containing protein [Rhodospirillales bacterium]